MKQLPEIIRTARRRKQLSQKALGEMLGVSNNAVSAWEKGESYPAGDILIKIIGILDIVSDLFPGYIKEETVEKEAKKYVEKGLEEAGKGFYEHVAKTVEDTKKTLNGYLEKMEKKRQGIIEEVDEIIEEKYQEIKKEKEAIQKEHDAAKEQYEEVQKLISRIEPIVQKIKDLPPEIKQYLKDTAPHHDK